MNGSPCLPDPVWEEGVSANYRLLLPQGMLKDEGGLGSILGCSAHFKRARSRPPTQLLWFPLPSLGVWGGVCVVGKWASTYRKPSPAGGLAKSVSRPG